MGRSEMMIFARRAHPPVVAAYSINWVSTYLQPFQPPIPARWFPKKRPKKIMQSFAILG